MEYLRLFQNHAAYTAATIDTTPTICVCKEEDEVHYQPEVYETMIVAKFWISNTGVTQVLYPEALPFYQGMEVDGVATNIASSYTFSTTGEHTVKYKLNDNMTSYVPYMSFWRCIEMTSVKIPEGVIQIDRSAFTTCTNLSSVTFPDSLSIISVESFCECTSLTSIIIPSNVTEIASQAFAYCSNLSRITSLARTAPIISDTFREVKTNGTLYVPQGSSGYDTWMQGLGNWTKVEQ